MSEPSKVEAYVATWRESTTGWQLAKRRLLQAAKEDLEAARLDERRKVLLEMQTLLRDCSYDENCSWFDEVENHVAEQLAELAKRGEPLCSK